MIQYIVGRNLGHLNRCVANLARLQKKTDIPLNIYAYKPTHAWLRANLPKVKIRSFKPSTLKKKKKIFLKSGLVIHDWREEVKTLKKVKDRKRSLVAGVYHSDLYPSSKDTRRAQKFKQQVQDIANRTSDIFFHMNLTQPRHIPKLSTAYVPVPIIVRDLTMKPGQVKKKLGLKEQEPFILVQMGGGMGKYRYKYMEEWYKKINHLKTAYRIVIANQLGGVDYAFHPGIKQAPLFDNGRDLVNAASLVISKPGMGILIDCLSTGTPLLALPADTKEREVKNMMLKDLVGSEAIASGKFSARDLSHCVEELMKHKKKFDKVSATIPQNGAQIMAQSMQLLHGQPQEALPQLHRKILKLTPFQI